MGGVTPGHPPLGPPRSCRPLAARAGGQRHLGGVAATVIRLKDIEQKSVGLDFKKSTFETIAKTLPQIISPLSDLRASKEYRMKVAENFFLKFHQEISSGVRS